MEEFTKLENIIQTLTSLVIGAGKVKGGRVQCLSFNFGTIQIIVIRRKMK